MASSCGRVNAADASITVIARDGIDSLSVRHVAAAAGVSAGAVQHHFPSRDALLLAALDRMVERQLLRVERSASSGSPIDALRAGVRALLPVTARRRDEGVVWVAFAAVAGAANAPSAVRRRYAEVVDLTRRRASHVIRRAQDTGEVTSAIDPDVAAAALMATVDGLVLHCLVEGTTRRKIEATADAAIAAILQISPVPQLGRATDGPAIADGSPTPASSSR
jgi:AcrR family transcriptional regulator